jgi:hypothetical protein
MKKEMLPNKLKITEVRGKASLENTEAVIVTVNKVYF